MKGREGDTFLRRSKIRSPTAVSTVAVSTPHKLWVCEPISEEPSSFQNQTHQRQHRPRAPLARTQSAPQLISTNTTLPVRINPPYGSLFRLFFAHPSSLVRPWQILSPVATRTMPVSVVPATSISRQPPLASPQSPCVMKSAISSPPSRTQ
jgi:hypothetical protein